MKRFVEGINRGQSTLFPERLEDWVQDDNAVRVIDVFVDEPDLVHPDDHERIRELRLDASDATADNCDLDYTYIIQNEYLNCCLFCKYIVTFDVI